MQFQTSPEALDRKEQNRLLRAVERTGNLRDVAIITTLLHCGLRVSEPCGLRLRDVEMSERKGIVRVHEDKLGKDRTVPTNADVRAALRKYLAVRPAATHDYVFVGLRGEPLGRAGVEWLCAHLAKRAGIRHVHPLVLRHTYALNLLTMGVPVTTVCRWLGHAAITATGVHLQPSEQDLWDAAKFLEE